MTGRPPGSDNGHALASLYNQAIDNFDYIELSRGLQEPFPFYQFKLDDARLRLSRWGNALGLSNDTRAQAQAILEGQYGAETVQRAQNLLGQILRRFDDFEGQSKKTKRQYASRDQRLLLVYNPKDDMDDATVDLHDKMRRVALQRQNKMSLRQNARWALYDDGSVQRLLEDTTKLTDALIGLFHGHLDVQRRLCDAEVSVFGTNINIPLLCQIASEQDKPLRDALSKNAGDENGVHKIEFSGTNYSGFQLGHNSGMISGCTFSKAD